MQFSILNHHVRPCIPKGVENTRFIGNQEHAMMSGQHCGLSSYHLGEHGVFCAVQWLTKNVTQSRTGNGDEGFIAPGFSFGASGGNPMMPTHGTFAGDDTYGASCRTQTNPTPSSDCNMFDENAPAWTILSGYWDGFTNVPGCIYYKDSELANTQDHRAAGAYACPFPIRRLTIHSPIDQGVMKLSGPGFDGVAPNPYSPVLGTIIDCPTVVKTKAP